jgi:hypothetical protein
MARPSCQMNWVHFWLKKFSWVHFWLKKGTKKKIYGGSHRAAPADQLNQRRDGAPASTEINGGAEPRKCGDQWWWISLPRAWSSAAPNSTKGSWRRGSDCLSVVRRDWLTAAISEWPSRFESYRWGEPRTHLCFAAVGCSYIVNS